MSDDTMPDIPMLDDEEEPAPAPAESKDELEMIIEEVEGEEEVEPEPEPEPIEVPEPQEDLFDLPVKPKKKKKQLSEKQLANLAKAREKAAVKRKAIAAAKKKERELALAEKKHHIKKRKARALQNQAEIEAYAEETVMQKEQSMWNEDKLTALMNRTMDTYFEKRKVEKTKRQQFPVDPAVYANYNPGAPPQRSIPRPAPAPAQLRNPYSAMFGLSPEDEELFGLNK
tara:strand:+ start:712 stop:1395 length:684 start_codon:yes stop_codon:yes gene_type:complete